MRIKPGTIVFSDSLIFRIIRHVALIVTMNLLFIWVAMSRSEDQGDFVHIAGMVLFNSFFFFSYAYITTYVLFPLLLMKRRFFWFGFAFLLTGLLISGIKLLFSDYIFYDAIAAELSNRMKNIDIVQVLTNTKDMTFIVAIFLIAKFAKDNFNMSKKIRELREKQLETEMKLIHNQLDPHVVFNNLNNLYSISLNKPQDVLPNVRRLRSLLSYYFSESKNPQVPVQQELQMIDDFIGLEKLRYGDRLDINYKISGSSNGRYIIPFVLFAFVENCFEHGCSIDTGKSWINIEIDIRENSLHFYAENSKPDILYLFGKDQPDSSLDDMRRRLEVLYPGRHYLAVKDEKTSFNVALKLKIA